VSDTSRRGFVVGATGAGLMFGLERPVEFMPAARAAEASGYFKYRVGEIEAFSLDDGTIERAVDASFISNAPIEEVRAVLASNGGTPDKYTNPFTVTGVRAGGKTVLFDTGFGATGPQTAGRLLVNMTAAGLDPAQVSTIVISHFHPDHVGGLWMKDTNAQVFPNAEILVPEAEYRYWTDPTVADRLPQSYRNPVIRAMAQRIQATFPNWQNLRPYTDGAEVASGIHAISTPGHSPGHMSFIVASGSKQHFLQVDVTGFDRLFVRHPGWHSRLDMDGPQAEATRRSFFERVLAEGGHVAGYHFSFPSVGTLARDGSSYVFVASSA
jgi:glyoxylase-like metal-dependent hydrolase (beta-lactamase superfamily II)